MSNDKNGICERANVKMFEQFYFCFVLLHEQCIQTVNMASRRNDNNNLNISLTNDTKTEYKYLYYSITCDAIVLFEAKLIGIFCECHTRHKTLAISR